MTREKSCFKLQPGSERADRRLYNFGWYFQIKNLSFELIALIAKSESLTAKIAEDQFYSCTIFVLNGEPSPPGGCTGPGWKAKPFWFLMQKVFSITKRDNFHPGPVETPGGWGLTIESVLMYTVPHLQDCCQQENFSEHVDKPWQSKWSTENLI